MTSSLIYTRSARLSCVLFCLASLALGTAADAGSRKSEVLPGPIEAQVERIIDGDTLIVRAKIWLGQELTIRVRLADINTPEMNASNPNQRRAAWKAYKALFLMTHNRQVILRNIRRGKYAGRVIADTYLKDGINISKALLRMRLAVPYGKKFKTAKTSARISDPTNSQP